MKQRTYKYKWLSGDKGKYLLIALLVLAFPVGLYIMWDEGKWKTWLKVLVTAAWAAIVLSAIIFIPMCTSMEYQLGGQELAHNDPRMVNGREYLAPLPPEDLPETSQLYQDVSSSRLISEPTPTPVPTYVYCNDNGKYYHLAGCRYVYANKTPHVTLTAARNAGKTACPYCRPPEEETYEK